MSSTQSNIKLIVGLGNPGAEYTDTRHNVGVWFVEQIAERHNLSFKLDKKFKSLTAKFSHGQHDVHLLIPQTYMNLSGLAIQAICQFYKIKPEEILVAHDELDFPAGTIKIKQSGGAGGHNGVKDTINKLGSNNFNRLRIGIGHPRNHNSPEAVHSYVLARPNTNERQKILESIESAFCELDNLLNGNIQKATQNLHQ